MKDILIIVLIMMALALCGMILPAIIGIAAGVALFKAGHFIWAIICIIGGIGINIGMIVGEFGSSGGYTGHSESHPAYHDEECPYCGSGDTDGNHCYNCDDDF